MDFSQPGRRGIGGSEKQENVSVELPESAWSPSGCSGVLLHPMRVIRLCRTYGARFVFNPFPALTPSARKRASGRAGLTSGRASGAWIVNGVGRFVGEQMHEGDHAHFAQDDSG